MQTKRMNVFERRQRLLEILCLRRQDTCDNLHMSSMFPIEQFVMILLYLPALTPLKQSADVMVVSEWRIGTELTTRMHQAGGLAQSKLTSLPSCATN